MAIQIERRNDLKCLILDVRGSFMDDGDAKQFRKAISSSIEEGLKYILVTAHDLQDLGRFGLETILATAFMADHAGGALQFFDLRSNVAEEFRSGGAERLISSAETEENAIDHLLLGSTGDGAGKPFDILEFVREEERYEEERKQEQHKAEGS